MEDKAKKKNKTKQNTHTHTHTHTQVCQNTWSIYELRPKLKRKCSWPKNSTKTEHSVRECIEELEIIMGSRGGGHNGQYKTHTHTHTHKVNSIKLLMS
jgi:hypothetical protein